MSYTKQTWATGDTITAEKLNHMEDGIAQGGGLQYDLSLVLSREDGQRVLTGHGLSPEELLAKINAGDITIATFVRLPSEADYVEPVTYICVQAEADNAQNNVTFTCAYNSPIQITNIGTQSCEFTIEGSSVFTYTYNSATKEYTFTYAGSAG